MAKGEIAFTIRQLQRLQIASIFERVNSFVQNCAWRFVVLTLFHIKTHVDALAANYFLKNVVAKWKTARHEYIFKSRLLKLCQIQGLGLEPQLGQHSFRRLIKSHCDERHSPSTNGLTVNLEKQPVARKVCCVRKPGNTWIGEHAAVIWLKHCWKRR